MSLQAHNRLERLARGPLITPGTPKSRCHDNRVDEKRDAEWNVHDGEYALIGRVLS